MQEMDHNMQCSIAIVLLIALLCTTADANKDGGAGCPSTGKMPGPRGSGRCPYPVEDEACPVTPSYESLQQKGVLWPCPVWEKTNGGANYGTCTPGSGPNPLCNFNAGSSQFGCCCPLEGCYAPPKFNWIIGVCKGSQCGGYNGAPSTKQYKNMGSQLVVNYVATYQWNTAERKWHLVEDSSFNTNGSKPAYDTIKPYGGLSQNDAWMNPQPGGAAAWTYGYYPAGVPGAGPPGMMFVLSAESVWNIAWYMLNQVNLDKGPTVSYPNSGCKDGNSNCWASGNSGEIDFLESAWTVNAGATDEYRRLYSTQWNQVGRSFVGDMGSTCNADGGWFSNQVASNNYFLGTKPNKPEPYVYAAVVDKVGTFIYRMPSASVDKLWPGLSRKTAACTLDARPTEMPQNSGPPCRDDAPYCALFLPNCQASEWGGASAGHQGGSNQGCKVNGQQGWCKNWWTWFDNTGQWLWPANGRKSRVQYQAPASIVEMPWNYEMESYKVDWSDKPVYSGGCCVHNTGHCP